MPHRASLPLNWRRKEERYRMKATQCENCKRIFFPPRLICPDCRRKGKIITAQIPEKGTLYSYTIMYAAPEGFENYVPYVIAIVELNDKTKIMTQLADVDFEKLKIGMPLKSVFRKVSSDGTSGLIHYSFKFTKDS